MTKRRETAACKHCGAHYKCNGRRQDYCSLPCVLNSRVVRGSADECWPWNGSRNDRGYGQFRRNNVNLYAHRIAYELAFGALGGRQALHRCDNPSCCNPAHLFAGTAKDNMIDMHTKRRWPAEMVAKGEDVAGSRLTEAKVREIRALYAAGRYSQYELARAFGVKQPTIGCVITRRTWKHVT